MSFASLKRALLALVLGVSIAAPASATWSIVVVNRRTGEVAIGSATCLAGLDLMNGLPTLRVGKGAGVIQAASGGEAGLVIIFDLLEQNALPGAILNQVKLADSNPESRQIGIVSMVGKPVTFSGRFASAARGGVTGQVGDLAYAIQGNVLTGREVWLAAEDALLTTPGDLGQKLVASMEAARDYGGDGRCSCSISGPTRCGAPPASFTKSAHCGFIVVSRMGDIDGTCTNGRYCASGRYYLKINIKGMDAQGNDPDPVDQIRAIYDRWRAFRVGTPDGILSSVDAVDALPADGVTERTVTVHVRDLEGNLLTSGGAGVRVETESGGPSLATIGPVRDNGDGTYSFTLTAGTTPGTDTLIVRANAATLFPYLAVRTDPVAPLHIGFDELSASESPTVPFVVNAPRHAGGRYLIVASLGGTTPGSMLGDFLLPLNPPLISVLNHAVDSARMPGTLGRLDETGRAEGAFVPGSALLTSLVGTRVDWSTVVVGGDGPFASPAVGFDIVP